MRTYWSRFAIPEMRDLPKQRRRSIYWLYQIGVLRRLDFWLSFAGFMAIGLFLTVPVVFACLTFFEGVVGFAAFLLGLLIVATALAPILVAPCRREIQNILAEEREAGDAPPPTEPSR